MIKVEYIPEPLLEFGGRQKAESPQDGLFLFGPVVTKGSPHAIHVGIVGTSIGIRLTREFLKDLKSRIAVKNPDKLHTLSWPGFQPVFGAQLVTDPLVIIELSRDEIERSIMKRNRTDAVRSTVKIFYQAIVDHLRNDERRPDVWLVVVPEVVHDFGRPEVSIPKEAIQSTLMPERMAADFLQEGALFPDLIAEAETYLFAKNFHHQLKAEFLDKDVIIQIIRETTLDPTLVLDNFGNPKRSVQEPAKIAWNFSTTLFFKARGQPWQLSDVRPGVCYVGLVFKQDPSPAARGEACCAAQMFLNSGNGVVFRGALGPWYSEKSGEFHLDQDAARDLIIQVITAYQRDHGEPPRELFIHGKQRFTRKEWDGFTSAAPSVTKLSGVRIRPSQDLRLFRPEVDVPVLRGTSVHLSEREGYLWTTGYTPRLRTYPGFETPKPISVDIHRSNFDCDIATVMKDVLALTKVNYNSCDFASGLPVTLKFADRVGEILTASPKGLAAPPLPFRFYI